MRIVLVVLFVLGAALLGGCTGGRSQPEASAQEALAFSGVVAPPGAEVLAVEAERGIDEFSRFALAVDPQSVDRLLADSRFRTPLEPGREPGQAVLKEVPLGTAIASADDELPPEGDRKNTVHREVLVDRSDPARAVVHVWAFTT